MFVLSVLCCLKVCVLAALLSILIALKTEEILGFVVDNISSQVNKDCIQDYKVILAL